MADTSSVASTTTTETTTVAQSPARMAVAASAGVASGGGTAGVIAYLWNWIMVRDYGAPQMGINDALALSVLLAPIFSYFLGWLPMPPVRNRRA